MSIVTISQRTETRLKIFWLLVIGYWLLFGILAVSKIEASDLNFLLESATSLYHEGRLEEAILKYKKAQKLFPESTLINLNLAVIYKDLGLYRQAIEEYKKALKNSPDDVYILKNLGLAYYLNDDLKEAIQVYKRAVKIEPEDSEIHFNLGRCFQEKGLLREAISHYRKAIKMDPHNALAYLNLGHIYSQKGSLGEAIHAYEKARNADPGIVEIHSLLGEAYFKKGNFTQALASYVRARSIEPEGARLRHFRQRIEEIYKRLGITEEERRIARRAQREERKSTPIQPIEEIEGVVNVRVGIMETEKPLNFKCGGPFRITTKGKGEPLLKGKAEEIWSIRLSRKSPDRLEILNPDGELIKETDAPIVLETDSPTATITIFDVRKGEGFFWAGQVDREYRGKMEVGISQGKALSLINIVNLEEYLYGVLPAEMPSDWPLEALKAQAVVARNQAMAKLGRHKEDGFDLCDDVHCQVYAGVSRETQTARKAVDSTRGEVLVYKGKVIDAVYHSSCGGHTQDNIWIGGDIPYLRGRPDVIGKKPCRPLSPVELRTWIKERPAVLCNNIYSNPANFRWARSYTRDELERLVNRALTLYPIGHTQGTGQIGELISIIPVERERSGHLSSLKLIGKKGTFIIEGELNIRRALGGLRSSAFKVETKYSRSDDHKGKIPTKFTFYGAGFGHGVGMCQAGAAGLALEGYSYREILKHYFSGVTIKDLY